MRALVCIVALACSSPRPVQLSPPSPPAQIDPDGDDDPADPGTGTAPASGHFERVGAPPLALKRICDLTPFGDALYMAHANSPLGSDGATITTYMPGAAKPFAVAIELRRRGWRRRDGRR